MTFSYLFGIFEIIGIYQIEDTFQGFLTSGIEIQCPFPSVESGNP